MTFQQLKYLQEAGRTGSVAQAAANLFISSSSISIAIRCLETELGYPIFTRSSKGLIPTERGKQVLAHVDKLCRTYDQLAALDHTPVRTIRINCNDNATIIDAIAQVMEENKDRKDLRFETTRHRGADMVYKFLMNGELDISLPCLLQHSLGFWEPKFESGDLHRTILKTIPAAIRVGPGHPLYDAKKLQPHDLKNMAMVDNPHDPLSQGPAFRSMLYIKPENVLYAALPNMQKALIQRGLAYGFSVMPSIVQRNVAPIRYIPLDGVNYHMLAVTSAQRPMAPEVLRILQLLKQNLETGYPESE